MGRDVEGIEKGSRAGWQGVGGAAREIESKWACERHGRRHRCTRMHSDDSCEP